MRNNQLIRHIIRQLLEVQSGKLWMGDNFEKKINAITDEEAFLRPLPQLHSAAELIAHLTAWRNDTILKIKNARGELTDNGENNWPDNDILKKIGWAVLIQSYRDSTFQIIELLKEKDDSFLNERYYDQDYGDHFEYSFAINGMLHHDLYHLGQLGIVLKLVKHGVRE